MDSIRAGRPPMRSSASPDDVVAVIADCSLEAAWITLAYALIGSLAADAPGPLTIVAFGIAALVGLTYARWAARDERRSHRTIFAVLVVGASIIGWLGPLGVDAGGLLSAPMAIVEMHPGGLLLGLAVLRGTAHVKPEDDERIAEIALGPGLATIVVIWFVLTLSGGTDEPPTMDVAFGATVTFITAGLVSMSLARLVGLRDPGAVGVERRTWIGVIAAVMAGMLAVAVPLALVVGVPLDQAIRGATGPVAAVLVPVVSLLLLPAALLGTLLVWFIGRLQTGGPDEPLDPIGSIGPVVTGWTKALGPSGTDAVILGFVPIVVALVVAFLLVRRFMGRPVPSMVERDVVEIRETEGPTGGMRIRLPRLPPPRRRTVPHTASEAYLASLDILSGSPDTARRGSETPAEHARRLRADPIGSTLGRLAADYALAEFGGRTLAASEHRRAIERWRRLRSMRER
jgi:hypothetical protein